MGGKGKEKISKVVEREMKFNRLLFAFAASHGDKFFFGGLSTRSQSMQITAMREN